MSEFNNSDNGYNDIDNTDNSENNINDVADTQTDIADEDIYEVNDADSEMESDYNGDAYDLEVDETVYVPESKTVDKKIADNIKEFAENKIHRFKNSDSSQKKKILITVAVILFLILLVLTDIIPILPNSYHRMYVGNSYVLGETMSSDAKPYGENVLYASNGSVFCFGPDMDLKFKRKIFTGIPKIRTNKNSAVVYSYGGGDAYIMSSANKFQTVRIDESIISASINVNADYVLHTSEKGYMACVSAYSSEHKPIYKWHTNSNITDTAISPSSKLIAVSAVDYSESDVYSKIIVLDTAQKNPLKEIVFADNIVSELYFPDENTIIAIGNSYTAAYTPTGSNKWKIDYKGKLLKTFDVSDDGRIALLFNRYNSELSESRIELYKFDGKMTGSYDSDANVRALSLNGKYCLLSLDKKTILIDDDGDVKKKKEIISDYQYMILYDNYNFAFGVSDSTAQILSVRH